MAEPTWVEIIRGMLRDWNAATPEQRAGALAVAKQGADAAERRMIADRPAVFVSWGPIDD